MFYKNTSCFAKTFYGVIFQPGETKEVSGYINNKFFVVTDAPQIKSVDKQQKLSSDQIKKEVPKVEAAKVEPVSEESTATIEIPVEIPDSAFPVAVTVAEAEPAKEPTKSSSKGRKS